MLVKHIVQCGGFVFGFRDLFSGSLRVNDALYPSKSGLINKHTVKHVVPCSCRANIVNHIVKHIVNV